MVDPATALSITSLVLQVVTMGKTLINRTQELYKSASGALVENQEIELVGRSLSALMENLDLEFSMIEGSPDTLFEIDELFLPPRKRTSDLERSHGGHNKGNGKETQLQELDNHSTVGTASKHDSDIVLSKLKRDLKSITGRLLGKLSMLRVDASMSKWQSFRQALRSVIAESELERLEDELNRIRNAIDTALLVSLRSHVQQVQDAQSSSSARIEDAISIVTKELRVRNELSSVIKKQAASGQLNRASITPSLCSGITRKQEDRQRQRILDNRNDTIMYQLEFKEMPNRLKAIHNAHDKTFKWIWLEHSETHRSSFTQWLQSDRPLYWITGKPGSGKSTLMKYLSQQPKEIKRLARPWSIQQSSNQELVVASFFFWNSGTRMQMVREGMFRTLLSQILKDRVDLLECAFPNRSRRLELFGDDLRPLELDEMVTALQNVFGDKRYTFLLLVDGLCEIDSTSDEASSIAELLRSLCDHKNVKICTSSRPWTVFEDILGDSPSLRVHDLTKQDILDYTTAEFTDSRYFKDMAQRQPDKAQRIVHEVAAKSNGVFLWVYVVVRSLKAGFRDGDFFQELQQKLDDLPDELEDLFSKILKHIEPGHAKQASEMFQLVKTDYEGTTIFSVYASSLSFQQAIDMEIGSELQEDDQEIIETVRRRIYGRCKCLLETENSPTLDSQVRWLHRSVREYLYKPDNWSKLVRKFSTDFDPDEATAVARVVKMKSSTFRQHWNSTEFYKNNVRSLTEVEKLSFLSKSKKIALLDEISGIGIAYMSEEMEQGRRPFVANSLCGQAWIPDDLRTQDVARITRQLSVDKGPFSCASRGRLWSTLSVLLKRCVKVDALDLFWAFEHTLELAPSAITSTSKDTARQIMKIIEMFLAKSIKSPRSARENIARAISAALEKGLNQEANDLLAVAKMKGLSQEASAVDASTGAQRSSRRVFVRLSSLLSA